MSLTGTNWENFEGTDGTGLFAVNGSTNASVGILPLTLGMLDLGWDGAWSGFYFTGEHCEVNDPEASYSYGWVSGADMTATNSEA